MTTTLSKKVDMYILYISDYSGNSLEETVYIHPDNVASIKKQLTEKVFIDIGGRMIPRKRVLDLKIEEEDESLIVFLSSLNKKQKQQAKDILAERKRKNLKVNGADHLMQIMKNRGLIDETSE